MASAVASLIPAGILSAMGLGILVANRILKLDRMAKWLCWVAIIVAAFALATAPAADPSSISASQFFLTDGFFRGSTWIALAFALLLSLSAADANREKIAHRYGLLLVSSSGVLLAAGANNLIVAVVAIELAALPATALLFIEKDSPHARAVWAQSWTLNLASLVILLAGVLLVAGAAGTFQLAHVDHIPAGGTRLIPSRILTLRSHLAADVGCVFLVAGLGVHFLAFPFQLAAAEIFDGAKSWCVSLTALFPRGAALLLMIRVLVNGTPQHESTAQTAFTAVGLVTILISCVLAFSQTRIRRLLAFAVTLEGGAIFGVLAAACSERKFPAATPWLSSEIPGAVGSACLCFGLDALAVVGLLAILGSLERFDRPLEEIEELAERARGNRVAATVLCVLLLSLAGFPPFGGFWGRVAVFRSLLSVGIPGENGFLPHQNIDYVTFSLVAAVGLITIAAVCASVARRLLLVDRRALRQDVPALPAAPSTQGPRGAAWWVGLFAAGALFVVGLFPGPFLRVTTGLVAPESVAPGTNEIGAAIRSPVSSPPVPSHTARRRIGIAAP